MTLEILSFVSLLCAGLASGLFSLNLLAYRKLAPAAPSSAAISVLIPARDEERNISQALNSILANRGIDFEVLVMDDHSKDSTGSIVAKYAQKGLPVTLLRAPELPPGWCGKMHVCHQLSRAAKHPFLLFMDADVRLSSDALVRLAKAFENPQNAYLSGIPKQEVETFSEKLLLPLIHFVLLCFLPIHLMRWFKSPKLSAGCGQFTFVRADAYHATGGHAAIRATLHDGIKLVRNFRAKGFKTLLVDLTDVASCRMYCSNSETWRGLAKNASEGLGSRESILPMTFLLMLGQIIPFALLPFQPALALWGIGLAYLPRFVSAIRFRQPLFSVILHPVGIAGLLAIQWFAFVRKLAGLPSVWKGRSYQVPKSARYATLFAGLLFAMSALGQTTNVICPSVTLKDQSGTAISLVFPSTNLTLLTIADKKGNEQMPKWIKGLLEFSDGCSVIGVADLSAVPKPLRGLINRQLKKSMEHRVMLDWDASLSKPLKALPDVANLYLLGTNGGVLLHLSGPATSSALAQVRSSILTLSGRVAANPSESR